MFVLCTHGNTLTLTRIILMHIGTHAHSQPASNNGLGSYNNIVTVSKKHFDAYFETWDLLAEKGWNYC